MRIVSGSTNEYIHFVAVSTSDFYTRVTDLTSFQVAASVGGSTGSTGYNITVSAVNSTQLAGVYKCLIHDSTLTTLPSGIDSREVVLNITSSMATVTRTVELYRRAVTTGATLVVDSSGAGNSNLIEIAGVTVSTASAQLGVRAVEVSTAAGNSVADQILDRDMATGTDSGSTTVRTVRQALRFLRNKWSIAGGTLTVTKEDDTTASWTSAVTTSATADPIIASDPAGP